MADEEDENVPKAKKEKEKGTSLPELAPGDVINPIEYKMFEPTNVQKTLTVPQRPAYSFQKELAGTLQKRLENIQIKLGSDDTHPITEKRVDMELIAGLQSWEEVDPISGQLLELRAVLAGSQTDWISDAPPAKSTVLLPGAATTPGAPSLAKHIGPHLHITPSVLATMRGALPKTKVEDRNAMPPVNRRNAATPKLFEGALKAQERAEYGDYYETIVKLDKQWKEVIGKRMSEFRPVEKKVEAAKAKDSKELVQKKKVSLAPGQPDGAPREKPEVSAVTSALNPFTMRQTIPPPTVKKAQGPGRPPGGK